MNVKGFNTQIFRFSFVTALFLTINGFGLNDCILAASEPVGLLKKIKDFNKSDSNQMNNLTSKAVNYVNNTHTAQLVNKKMQNWKHSKGGIKAGILKDQAVLAVTKALSHE